MLGRLSRELELMLWSRWLFIPASVHPRPSQGVNSSSWPHCPTTARQGLRAGWSSLLRQRLCVERGQNIRPGLTSEERALRTECKPQPVLCDHLWLHVHCEHPQIPKSVCSLLHRPLPGLLLLPAMLFLLFPWLLPVCPPEVSLDQLPFRKPVP